MSKSLGEKLFDAMLDVSGETDLWAGIGAFEQSQTERIALAFCAALSHDETATATIEALISERDSLLAALKPFAREAGAWLDRTPDETIVLTMGPSDDGPSCSEFTLGDLRCAAALTTKEG